MKQYQVQTKEKTIETQTQIFFAENRTQAEIFASGKYHRGDFSPNELPEIEIVYKVEGMPFIK